MPTLAPSIDFSDGVTIGGVQCYDQGTEEDFNQFDSVATRTLACRWEDRISLINALNPQGTSLAGVFLSNGQIPYPDAPNLWPQRFRTKAIPGSRLKQMPSGLVGYDFCLLTAEYRPFRGGDAQGYVEFDMGANVITMPGSGTWLETADLQDYTSSDGSSGGQARMPVPLQDCARGYPVPVIGIVRGRSNVAGLNSGLFASVAAAPINSEPFLNFPAGTVIFEGARARKQTLTNAGSGTTTNGAGLLDGSWEIECRFQARPAMQWDYLPFRQKVGSVFQFVIKKVQLSNSQGPYLGRSDLNQLFA